MSQDMTSINRALHAAVLELSCGTEDPEHLISALRTVVRVLDPALALQLDQDAEAAVAEVKRRLGFIPSSPVPVSKAEQVAKDLSAAFLRNGQYGHGT